MDCFCQPAGLSHGLPTSEGKPAPRRGKILFRDAQIILSG